jgi:hypothetical protein
MRAAVSSVSRDALTTRKGDGGHSRRAGRRRGDHPAASPNNQVIDLAGWSAVNGECCPLGEAEIPGPPFDARRGSRHRRKAR